MGLFNVPVMLTNPDDPQRSMVVEMLVDTGSTYLLLPPEVVAALGLPIREHRPAELASGERVVYGVGEVRVRPTLLGALTLKAFGLAADPVHQRIFPVTARF
jgi:predicted aspartyl protease